MDPSKGNVFIRMSQILWAVALHPQREVELRLPEVLEAPGCGGDLLLLGALPAPGFNCSCSDDLRASLSKGLLSL